MENTSNTEELDYSTFTKEALEKEMMLAFSDIAHHQRIISNAQEAITELNEAINTLSKLVAKN